MPDDRGRRLDVGRVGEQIWLIRVEAGGQMRCLFIPGPIPALQKKDNFDNNYSPVIPVFLSK